MMLYSVAALLMAAVLVILTRYSLKDVKQTVLSLDLRGRVPDNMVGMFAKMLGYMDTFVISYALLITWAVAAIIFGEAARGLGYLVFYMFSMLVLVLYCNAIPNIMRWAVTPLELWAAFMATKLLLEIGTFASHSISVYYKILMAVAVVALCNLWGYACRRFRYANTINTFLCALILCILSYIASDPLSACLCTAVLGTFLGDGVMDWHHNTAMAKNQDASGEFFCCILISIAAILCHSTALNTAAVVALPVVIMPISAVVAYMINKQFSRGEMTS